MLSSNNIPENIENALNEVTETTESESTLETTEHIPKETIDLINIQYVHDVAYFAIFLFLILSFTDVGITVVSKIISFFKTVFDDIDLKFMKIKK